MDPVDVLLCEVGPRDGLQAEATVLSVDTRVDLIDRLSACGFPRIEAASFVNPARVPQMAGAEEVLARVGRRPGTEYVGLVLNTKGAHRALESSVDRLNYAFVVTETFNERNQGRTIAESLAELEQVVGAGAAAGTPTTVILASSFGCPFEGPVPRDRVLSLVDAVVARGATEIVLSDTIGVAVPTQVSVLIEATASRVPMGMRVGCHLHNTRNTGLANAASAVASGATLLDASVGGAGGCPFAPRATGNVPTEDLLYMLDGVGHRTGVQIERVIEVARWLESQLGHQLPGMVKEAGATWHTAPVRG